MSEKLGPVAVLAGDGTGQSPTGETSPETQRITDLEVQRLVESAHAEVTDLLSDHRPELERLSRALLKAEARTAADAYIAAGVPVPSPGADADQHLVST